MKIALIVSGLIVALFAILYAYYGGFRKVTFSIENQGGEMLIYKEMTGDYSKSGKLMDEIYYALLNDYGIETYRGFGIYYDNPKEVEKIKLRSEVGCVIEEKDIAKLEKLPEDFKTKRYPEKQSVVAEFPHKGMPSIFVGIIKVYPALNKYVNENNLDPSGAVMEIYDVPNKKIIYRKAISEGS